MGCAIGLLLLMLCYTCVASLTKLTSRLVKLLLVELGAEAISMICIKHGVLVMESRDMTAMAVIIKNRMIASVCNSVYQSPRCLPLCRATLWPMSISQYAALAFMFEQSMRLYSGFTSFSKLPIACMCPSFRHCRGGTRPRKLQLRCCFLWSFRIMHTDCSLVPSHHLPGWVIDS